MTYIVSSGALNSTPTNIRCIVIHVNNVHFAVFNSFITWEDVCCICIVGELCNMMDIDAATDTIKEEHLPVEETDDSCVFKYFEIVPLARDTDGSCTTECVSGDWSVEVKQENFTVIKQEPNDVCFVVWLQYTGKISRIQV